MNKTIHLSSQLEWVNSTIRFFKKHFFTVFTPGLIAGLGRVAQLRGFGPISPTQHIILEVIIETARIALFVYVLGSASLRSGFTRLAAIFQNTPNRREKLKLVLNNLKKRWPAMLLNFLAYSLIALGINFLIDKLAYQTCFYLAMQQKGMLSGDSSEWTVILFFKNLTVIPLTLIFNAILLFYLTDRLKDKPRQAQI